MYRKVRECRWRNEASENDLGSCLTKNNHMQRTLLSDKKWQRVCNEHSIADNHTDGRQRANKPLCYWLTVWRKHELNLLCPSTETAATKSGGAKTTKQGLWKLYGPHVLQKNLCCSAAKIEHCRFSKQKASSNIWFIVAVNTRQERDDLWKMNANGMYLQWNYNKKVLAKHEPHL